MTQNLLLIRFLLVFVQLLRLAQNVYLHNLCFCTEIFMCSIKQSSTKQELNQEPWNGVLRPASYLLMNTIMNTWTKEYPWLPPSVVFRTTIKQLWFEKHFDTSPLLHCAFRGISTLNAQHAHEPLENTQNMTMHAILRMWFQWCGWSVCFIFVSCLITL